MCKHSSFFFQVEEHTCHGRNEGDIVRVGDDGVPSGVRRVDVWLEKLEDTIRGKAIFQEKKSTLRVEELVTGWLAGYLNLGRDIVLPVSDIDHAEEGTEKEEDETIDRRRRHFDSVWGLFCVNGLFYIEGGGKLDCGRRIL